MGIFGIGGRCNKTLGELKAGTHSSGVGLTAASCNKTLGELKAKCESCGSRNIRVVAIRL